jgi:hypothetical protein
MEQILQLEKVILENRKNINSLTQLREVRHCRLRREEGVRCELFTHFSFCTFSDQIFEKNDNSEIKLKALHSLRF